MSVFTSVASPVTPECLMSREGLDQVWAQLHLLVEKLKDWGEAELPLLLTRCLCSRQLPVSLGVAVMVGAAAAAAAGDCAGAVLGWAGGGGGGGGSWSLGELSDQLLEQELAVVEATVVRNMHGHPEAHGGEFIMENLWGDMKESEKGSWWGHENTINWVTAAQNMPTDSWTIWCFLFLPLNNWSSHFWH